jgi:hypothetical protein
MVRRWSRINYFNQTKVLNFQHVYESTFDFNVNSNMYLRKRFSPDTTLTRRKWARRKHLTSWLPLSIVMSDWSQAYRFNRQLLKSFYAYSLTKTAIISFSTLGFKNSLPSVHKNTENVVMSSISKKLITYFQTSTPTYLRFFSTCRNANLTFLAFATNADLTSIENDSTVFIQLFVNSLDTFTPSTRNLKKVVTTASTLTKLFNLPNYLVSSSLTPLYNTLVLLTRLHSLTP